MWSKVLSKEQVSVTRIQLPGLWPGGEDFLSPWLVTLKNGESVNILIDPGPTASIPDLAKALRNLQITNLDWIFLTHIHIDHAGGVGSLLNLFPSAKVLVHHKGKQHLVNPDKLWQGSIATLGTLAEAYGEIDPVPEEALVDASTITGDILSFTVLDTPGHAPHHLSFLLESGPERILFAGEAAGIFLPIGKAKHSDLYMRPATPPKFYFETSVKTLDLLSRTKPTVVFCGHYGFLKSNYEPLKKHRTQLHLWRDIIGAHKNHDHSKVLKELLANDPLLGSVDSFEVDIKNREIYFLNNSIKGFLGYFERAEKT